jgi:hypothetical protein
LKDEIIQLVKLKADAEDVLNLAEIKTNKADTLEHINCLEDMHRMISNINTLLIELAK